MTYNDLISTLCDGVASVHFRCVTWSVDKINFGFMFVVLFLKLILVLFWVLS